MLDPHTPATLADVARLQRAHHAEVREALANMAADLAALLALVQPAAAPRLQPAEADLLRQLLPLVFARWRGGVFEAAELVALAECDTHMRQVLAPKLAGGGDPAKRLGKLLTRCDGSSFAGYVLRVHRNRSPLLFVVESNPLQTHETRSRP